MYNEEGHVKHDLKQVLGVPNSLCLAKMLVRLQHLSITSGSANSFWRARHVRQCSGWETGTL